jgi:hypothetical protein
MHIENIDVSCFSSQRTQSMSTFYDKHLRRNVILNLQYDGQIQSVDDKIDQMMKLEILTDSQVLKNWLLLLDLILL